MPRRRSQVKPPAAEPADSGIVNAYWYDNSLFLVKSGGSTKTMPAEYALFVERASMKRKLHRELRQSAAVTGMRNEGEYVRVNFRTRPHALKAAEWLDANGVQTFEADVSPTRRFLADNGIKVSKPRLCYLDIETDSRLSFSRKEEMTILAVSIVDGATGETVFSEVLEEFAAEAERALLERMWTALGGYDQVAAWNGDRFDFPVIKARSGEHGLAQARPIAWRRWLWLDHLELFRRMNMMAAESGEEKTSFALGAVAQSVLGYGKVDFDASKTFEAWEDVEGCGLPPTDPKACLACRECMQFYCDHDTRLMYDIEQKTGYIDLLLTLSQACNTFPDSRGINPTIQVEGFLLRLAVERGYHYPTQLHRHTDGKYRGAFVMEPTQKGIVKDVHVADFAGLYPNIMVSWNMSPETLLPAGPVEDRPAAHAPITDVYFDTSQVGVLPSALLKLMELRKVWSDRKATAKPGSPEWHEADRRSTAYKIATNSFYGVIGSPMSRFYNRAVAEACTQCGVWLIQQTIEAAAKQWGLSVIYGDTDSVFVLGCSEKRFRDFVEWANADLYPALLAKEACPEQRITLAYEKQFERIVFCAAKRYAGRYKHYKGTAADADDPKAVEVKGLEYKRGDSARLARQLQEQVVQKLLTERCEDPLACEQVLVDWETRLKVDPLEPEEVMVSKRLSKPLEEYVRREKKDGTYARQLPHIELARQLAERGEDVGEGVRIRYFVTDGAARPKEVLAEQDWRGDHQVDRYELWDALVAPPTVRLLEAAFPGHAWGGFLRTRPKLPRKPRKGGKGPTTKPKGGQGVPPGAGAATGQPGPPTGPPKRRRRRSQVARGA